MKQHHKIMIFSYSELEHMFNHSKDTHAMYYYDINNIKEISKLCIQTCDARVIYTLTKQIRKMKSKDENINKKILLELFILLCISDIHSNITYDDIIKIHPTYN